jgi:hypothetical protein
MEKQAWRTCEECIQMPIIIVVGPHRIVTRAPVHHDRISAHPGERAVAVVVKQIVVPRSIYRANEIEVAVIVVIPPGGAP